MLLAKLLSSNHELCRVNDRVEFETFGDGMKFCY